MKNKYLENKKCLLSFSGGKDSLACLQLCLDSNVADLQLYCKVFIPGMDSDEQFLQYIEKRINRKILRLPHFVNSTLLKYGFYSYVPVDIKKQLKQKDMEEMAKEKLNCQDYWIVNGSRKNESMTRAVMFKPIKDGFDEKNKRIYPVWDWKEGQIYKYLTKNRWRTIFPKGIRGSGIFKDYILYLRDKYPQDLPKLFAVYPLAEKFLHDDEVAE